MVGRKKKPKTCDHGSHEDRISPLPDDLISHILTHLSTCDVLRTSLLSKRWISLWERVPDLDSHSFSSFDALVIKQLEPQLQFPYLSQLSASFSVFDLKVLPIILRSCPKLKSLILDLVDREMEPVRYFLKNSRVLEKLSLSFENHNRKKANSPGTPYNTKML
ncbi:unnamed protein product [Brassica rapa]|uniref:F-box domain-containing protein n=1 Tax=Brassica campestris TaxID=3711 RepID=A0A3P6D519_BRACM|nr:unnamed protein product [Brassica rapa]VDD17485.1 unnamed protein product [Brassica rapa]